MITNRKDLKRYLECDRIALGINYKHPKLFIDRLWKFQIQYRKLEYFYNNKNNPFYFIIYAIRKIIFRKKCDKLNCEFPLNIIDEGLSIFHGHRIIINGYAKIGKNFSISSGCVVGQSKGKTPIIGDNVQMHIDSTIIGDVQICNNTTLGAKTLVVKDVMEESVTLGGVPAKIISRNLNKYMMNRRNKMEELNLL